MKSKSAFKDLVKFTKECFRGKGVKEKVLVLYPFVYKRLIKDGIIKEDGQIIGYNE